MHPTSCHKPVDKNGLLLSQSVGPVDGLHINGWIPADIEDDDPSGPCEVQSGAACARRYKEDLLTTVLNVEGVNCLLPVNYVRHTLPVHS